MVLEREGSSVLSFPPALLTNMISSDAATVGLVEEGNVIPPSNAILYRVDVSSCNVVLRTIARKCC